MGFKVLISSYKICSSIEYTAANIASPASLKIADVIYFPMSSAIEEESII